MVIEIEWGAVNHPVVHLEDRELCIHWQAQDQLGASEIRIHVPAGYSLESARASFNHGILRIEVPPNEYSTGSKPLPMLIHCDACGKYFDIIVGNKSAESHRCPHCGQDQIFKLDSLVKKAIEQGKKMLRKSGGRR